ncbi:MAG: DUF6164 family protein [Ghiorsea sp.]
MSVMLFKLRGVEEDEADEIRALLTEHEIDFYETSNGRWGLGYAAVWLRDESNFDQSKALIEGYQVKRYKDARENYQQLCLDGKQPTIWGIIQQRPLQVLFALIAIMIVGIFALTPFLFL